MDTVLKAFLDHHVNFSRFDVLEPTLEEIFIAATREETER